MSDLKAFSVQDPSTERGEIVFANCNAAARRIGANQIDSEWESVECRRAPEFDKFSPGPVSDMVKLNHGWWLECTGCYREIAGDYVTDEDGEDHEVTPVERNGHVFCTADCETADRLDRDARRAAEKVALDELRARLLALHPDVTLTGNDHAYVERKDGVYRPTQVMIRFRFTGCEIGDASYRYDEAGEAPAIWVCNGDKDAWAAYRGGTVAPINEVA
jgi:hypothetical protein